MYRIIGADSKEYGPFTADQLRQWVAENRANASTLTLAEGATEWKPLSTLPEFAALFSAPAPTTPPPPAAPAAYQPPFTTGPKTNGFALAGFILGLCSFPMFCCCIGPMCNIVAIVFCIIGLAQTGRRPDLYSGKALAIVGLVLALLGLVLYFVLMILGVAGSIGPEGGPHRYRL